jgi:hypothetical protein
MSLQSHMWPSCCHMSLAESWWAHPLKSLRKLLIEVAARDFSEVERMPISEDELELFHDLCMVWIEGPMAQRYILKHDPEVAPHAAREVRKAIENSVLSGCDFSGDHVALLRRIESTLAPEPRGLVTAAARYLLGALARARPLIRSILASRPW